MPANITPIFLPSRALELNPVENVWQYLRQNWLSSKTTTPLATPLETRGEGSPQSQTKSHPSECANGPTSVSRHDLWYKVA